MGAYNITSPNTEAETTQIIANAGMRGLGIEPVWYQLEKAHNRIISAV